jgi:hypothetical protein
MRDSREPQTEGSVGWRARIGRRGSGAGRRPWARSIALLLPLLLVLAASLAPIGQAHPARERTPEEEAAKAQAKLAEKEQHAAQRQEQREVQAKLRRSAGDTKTRENGGVSVSCTQVTWSYQSFPDLPGNTVTERLEIGHAAPTTKTFTFDGSTGTDVETIAAPPGPGGAAYRIDAWARWKTNGVHGGFDIPVKVKCDPTPGLAIEKLQRIEGTGGSYTSAPLTAQVGQVVDYEVIARNTGNVPLSLGSFTDPRCDPGTIAGGTGGEALAVGASTTYTCIHLLGSADEAAGSYTNTVTLTGTPPAGEGSPSSETSNTVVVEVAPPTAPPPSNEGSTPSKSTTSTGSTSTPASGVLPFVAAQSPVQPPRSGVLAFSAASVPKLNGPQGCVRSGFRVSIKSAGVAGVIFYLDGHKLGRLTAHSAHRGLLAITINPAKLSLGAHHLLAKITMVKAPGASKAVSASRRMTVLHCGSAAVTPKFTG